MKHFLGLCGLLLCLCLSGCSAMLEHSYLSVTPHSYLFLTPQDDSIIQVSTYQELVGAILNMVSTGETKGTIQFINYTRDAQDDLHTACLEVEHQDPLGAYAVEEITYEITPILTYYQSVVTIDYRRTTVQIESVVPVTGSQAMRIQMEQALQTFQTELVLQVTYFSQDEDYIRDLAYQAYLAAPAVAFGMPDIDISIYPDSGFSRVIEMSFSYPDSIPILQGRSAQVIAAAQTLIAPTLELAFKDRLLLSSLYDDFSTHLATMAELEPLESWADKLLYTSTPYAALIAGQPDSLTVALTFQLLCDLSGASCQVVEGTLDGQPYYWNIVTVNEENRHIDLHFGQEGFYRTDTSYAELSGAEWDRDAYPQCGTPETDFSFLPVD